ncbi:MAG: hypothetical protein FE048_04395 [Thermoplasmata archaeon]|nr:MAG: hypothetical protein FE048_04395 [Thermoplasmata archaeon]
MALTDLTSMGKPQWDVKNEISQRLQKLVETLPDYCFQCAKCTSGCEAHKLLELEPHKVIALVKRGLIDELVNSDIIWTCVTCLKCRERCPQNVSPVDALFALKNMAVAQGKQIPGKYTAMLQSILSTGLIQSIQKSLTREGKTKGRDELNLPSFSKPKNMEKFMATLTKIAMEKI